MTTLPQTKVPKQIGNYLLDKQIGKGGMSEVWLARHLSLENRLIAVKLLLSQDPEWIERFTREANITSRLRHEYIVQIYDHGQELSYHYTIMQYVPGGALRELLKGHRPLPLDLALRILHSAGTALDYAHAHGVIHRDVSPGNILIEQDTGRVLLTDFGIARESGKTGMTTISKVMGTPGYLSPEHASSATAVTHLSDIYSLGVVLYEMLSGSLPWDHNPGMPDKTGGPFDDPPPLRTRGAERLPPDVDRVLRTMLAFDPAKRYPSAQAAIDDLDQVLSRHTGPTQVVAAGPLGGSSAGANGRGPVSAATGVVIPSPTLEQHPVETALGPDLIKGPLQKARERADALADQSEVAALLDRWSNEGPLRRKLLGRQAAFHRVSSANVYFYTLKVLYETRETVRTHEEPDHKAQPIKIEKEQDRWTVALPPSKGFVEDPGATITLPGSTQVLTCDECEGHGKVVCPRCQGRARIIVVREAAGKSAPAASAPAAKASGAPAATAAAPAQPAPALVPCPDCSGTGSLVCERCEGAGRLIQKKTITWRRRAATLEANDDLPRIDEQWLHKTCKATEVYCEQQQAGLRPEWQHVPPLAEMITAAQGKLDPNTRIALSEVSITFIPVTEIVFDLGAAPPPPAPPQPAKKGAKPAPPRAPDAGLYRWHIYGFEKRLPKDWRFLNWDRVLLLSFGFLLVVMLVLLVVAVRF